MANFEFVLPLTKDQLLRAERVGQYYVKDVVPAREIGAQVRGFLSKKRLLDTKCVVDSFDLLYSVITNFNSVDEKVVQDAFDLALLGISKVESDLTILLQNADATLDFDTKKQAQNHLKMSSYVLCHLIELIEAEASKPSPDVAASATKGRKKTAANNMKFLEWASQKLKAVQCLKNIHELALQCLWSPQPVEDEYINLVADCFFKLIEDAGNLKSSTVKDAFTTVIGLNIKRHGYAIGCVMKIIQVLQAHEHVAPFFAEVLSIFSEKFGMKSIVGDCIRELCRLDSLENAQDCGGIRNLSTFLVELTDRMPVLVTKSAGLLVELLNVKNYTVRIGVLTAFFKIVLDVLSKEGLDNKEKELRDALLDHLEEHILDENAFVRSKVLQLWQEMCSKKCIPLDRQQTLLELISNRLCDKSSVVRKHAVGFVSSYLASNPFLAKLSPEELRKNLAEEEEKLQALRILHKDVEDEEQEDEADASWMGILPGLQEVLQEDEDQLKDISLTDEESVLLDEILNKIRALLKSGSCTEAVMVLRKAIATYPDVNLFCNPSLGEEGSEDNKGKENGVKDSTDQVLLNVLKKIYQGTKVAAPDEEAPKKAAAKPDAPPHDTASGDGAVDLYKQKMLVLYLKDCTGFAEKIQAIIPTLCEMLYSRTQSDIHEAIAFFVSAHCLGIKGAILGIRKMLPLVWSREPSIREAVANSYRDVYFNQPAANAKTRARNIADGLSELVNVVTTSELICLEQLVTELVKSGDISPTVLRFLWDRYTMEQPDTAREECLAATQLLSMVASADSNMVTKNLELLISVGLGERGKADLDFCRHTLSIIQKMGGTVSASKAPLQRFENSDKMFVRLQDILLETFCDTSISIWIPTMERALDVIYKYAQQPAKISDSVLKGLAERLLSRCRQQVAVDGVVHAKPQDSQSSQEENEEMTLEESPQTPSFECPSLLLSRIVACVGHVALRQLIFLDVDVFAQLKRKRESAKDRKEEQVAKRKKRQSMSATSHVLSQSQEGPDSQNADDEMMGPVTEDTDAEYIVHLLDNVVLSDESSLGVWSKLVVHVVTEQSTYTDEGLCTVASLALAKLMTINAEFCERHLVLLFNIMENSPDPVIRTNLVVAAGDLMVRFPNLLYTWTEKIYARLQDSSRDVKLGTLKTVIFLILNDMIKVKGQISDIAAMVMDEDAELADMCRNFFFELGSKGNALYNLLPDIISHLSDEEHGIDEKSFRVVMKLLFSCISKDRQLENFVEKLCFRFMTMTTERHWRDLAYCLSLIPFGERGIKKLHENVVCFADKMHVDAVYESIMGIISNAKKAQVMKADVKVILQELEDLIEELRNKGLTESELVQRTKKGIAQASAKKRGNKQSCATPRGQKTPARGKRRCRKKMSRLSESSNEDEEEEEASPPPTTRKALPRRQCKLQIQFSDSSEVEVDDNDDE